MNIKLLREKNKTPESDMVGVCICDQEENYRVLNLQKYLELKIDIYRFYTFSIL